MKKKIGSLDTYLDEYVLSLLETGKKSSGNSKFMCRQWNSGDLSISCTDAGWGKAGAFVGHVPGVAKQTLVGHCGAYVPCS